MKVTVSFDPHKQRFMVHYLVPTGQSGVYQRKRKFFLTESEAKAEAASVRRTYERHGLIGLSVDPQQWQRYKFLESRLLGIGTLEDAVNFYLQKKPSTDAPHLEVLIERFLDHKKPMVTHRWHRTLVRYLLRFSRRHPGVRASEITPDQVSAFMDDFPSAESRANIRRIIFDLYGWAKRHDIVPRNVVELVPVPRVVRDGVSVMPVKDAWNMLHYVAKEEPALIPFVALRMFAGLRTTAAERIDWSEIKVGVGIELPAVKAKNRRRAFLEGFPPVLWDWLRPHAKESGRVGRTHYNPLLTALCRTHNIEFPMNVLRHSFATYHLAAFRNISETVLLLSHRGSPRVLWEHYNGRASKDDAVEYFKLTPERVTSDPYSAPQTPSAAQ